VKPPLQLNLGLLTHFEAPGVFTRIDPAVFAAMSPLREVLERVKGCVHFSHRMKADFAHRLTPTADEVDSRRKYLRATLSEYASMEDAAKIDFASLGKPLPPRMRSLTDPRIHVVRLLRHANIHLAATPLSHSHRGAVWRGPDGEHEFQYLVVTAEDVASSVRRTNEAKAYASSDLLEMIRWLECEQQEWGIGHVVLRSAETYGRYLAAAL